jgi:6-phosphogluconolactonase
VREESGTRHEGMEVKRFDHLNELSLAAAQLILQQALKEVKKKRYFTLVLSGGKTPRLLYQTLASSKLKEKMPREKVHLFWGDERFVPIDHSESNFNLANQQLISKVPVPPENIHRIPVEERTAEKAAQKYEKILKDFFQGTVKKKPYPPFDLILLGVGSDGHTASLFLGSEALKEKKR